MITNTAKENSSIHLLTAIAKGGIEEQEARGQMELVSSEVLPSTGSWGELEKLGVKRGAHVEGDDMFVYAELPAGWKKRRTDHSMWSELIDENGVVKANIFYKAAFYDRSAHIHTV